MGMSIDIHTYDYFELIKDIQSRVEENGGLPEGRTLEFFVEKILPRFGFRASDKYVTLWNEYYSDSGYNSASELFRAVEMYFGLEDVFLGGYGYAEHQNADELFEELGIESLSEGEEYE